MSAARAVLREFVENPALTAHDLHEQCAELGIPGYEVSDFEVTPRLLDAARWLIRHGTSRHAVGMGLGLLRRHAEPDDVPVIRMLGLLDFAVRSAAGALLWLGAAHDVIWLSERSNRYPRQAAAEDLIAHPAPDVQRWVRGVLRESMSGRSARRIAEEHGLLDLLAEPDDLLWDEAGDFLYAMTRSVHHTFQITWYRDAAKAFQLWVEHARERPSTVDRAARLASVAQSLSSGSAALATVDIRADLITQINAVLKTWLEQLRPGDRAEARRLQWIEDQTKRNGVPTNRFALHIVVADPAGPGQVEVRPLINGLPVIPAAFDRSAGEGPDELLRGDALRATTEPREIRLADSYCDEVCTGALYVTIVRDGDEVVWRDWRSTERGDWSPGVFRFDVGEYERELIRAAHDFGWEWPAWTMARLVRDALEAEPEILGQWDCDFSAATAWFDEMMFKFTSIEADDYALAGWSIKLTMGDRTAEDVAAELVGQLRNTDPRLTATELWDRRNR